jgi:hypothetical protein
VAIACPARNPRLLLPDEVNFPDAVNEAALRATIDVAERPPCR